uniref:Uncharacterized protein n=1 Tax=Arundo donax TaxID=35708 RepID=A0A0A9BDM8_ARUDO
MSSALQTKACCC